MTWQEAYPASSGSVCTVCDTTRLGWLGADVNTAEGREQNKAIVEALTKGKDDGDQKA